MGDISSLSLFTPSKSFVVDNLTEASAAWFLFRQDNILVDERNGRVTVPRAVTPAALNINAHQLRCLGTLSQTACYTGELVDADPVPDGMACVALRGLFGRLDDRVYGLAGTALQLVNWDRGHRYCGRCGTETLLMTSERARICPACELINHPRISPAVIVAVIRSGKILFGRSGRFPKPNFFSVLAGYVEVGETLEACVHREVMEEVGIRIRNLRYFGSQPWPYSGALMAAFTAEWASGEISVDGEEILEAGWYGPRELPMTPGLGSVAARLIDWFKHTYG